MYGIHLPLMARNLQGIEALWRHTANVLVLPLDQALGTLAEAASLAVYAASLAPPQRLDQVRLLLGGRAPVRFSGPPCSRSWTCCREVFRRPTAMAAPTMCLTMRYRKPWPVTYSP